MPENFSTIISVIAASAAIIGLIFSAYQWAKRTVQTTNKSIDELKTALKVTPKVVFIETLLVHAPDMHGELMMVEEGTSGEVQSVKDGFAKVKLSGSTTIVYAPLLAIKLI